MPMGKPYTTSLVLQKIKGVLDWIHWIDGGPGEPGPLTSRAVRAWMVSTVMREVAAKMSDERTGREVHALAQKMAGRAHAGLLAGWEEGDDLCPPWLRGPRPPKRPWWTDLDIALGPQPEPWLESLPGPVRDGLMLHGVRELAERVGDGDAAQALGGLALGLDARAR